MDAGEPGEIVRRDQCPAGDIFEVGGKLRPEGRFKRDLLANGDDAHVCECGGDLGDPGVDFGGGLASHSDGHMVLAEACTACGDIILGLAQLVAQGEGLIFCRSHPTQGKVHQLKSGLPFDESKRLRDRQLERKPHELVEHPWRTERRIVFDRNEREKAARDVTRG